jgi:hypothetical protein
MVIEPVVVVVADAPQQSREGPPGFFDYLTREAAVELRPEWEGAHDRRRGPPFGDDNRSAGRLGVPLDLEREDVGGPGSVSAILPSMIRPRILFSAPS